MGNDTDILPTAGFDAASVYILFAICHTSYMCLVVGRAVLIQFLVVKLSLGCAINWWQGTLGRTQRYQPAGVISCHLGALLPSHQESLQYNNERQIV